MTRALNERLTACGNGKIPHTVRVTIREFEDQNVAKSILIGDEIELGGDVQVVKRANGRTVAEYYVKESFFWGGLAGAALMSNAEESLSRDFAEAICKKILNN